jgi:hypothetical protein
LIAEKYVQNYVESKNYAEANARGKQLRSYAIDLSEAQQRRILAGIDANDQIRDSFEAGPLIFDLRNAGRIAPDEFVKLLRSCGLEKFLPYVEDDAVE